VIERASRIAYVGVGSNQLAEDNIARGMALLAARFRIAQRSRMYTSKDTTGQGADYLNLVVGLICAPTMSVLKDQCREVERLCGRDRNEPSAVALDLDVLMLVDTTAEPAVSESYLPPVSEFGKSAHVLLPLADLLPDWIHPDRGVTLTEICAELGDAAIRPIEYRAHEG
tara:strand:+ start:209 stop:718 length:510 start_codon:yes stop_codon:yes gene_type:complete